MGVTREEAKALLEGVRANHRALDACAGHEFVDITPEKKLDKRHRCKACGGTADSIAVHWYNVGRKHHDERARVLTCAFCGSAYPPGTPESNHDRLLAHVLVCPDHPMREVEAERDEAVAQLTAGAALCTCGHPRTAHAAKLPAPCRHGLTLTDEADAVERMAERWPAAEDSDRLVSLRTVLDELKQTADDIVTGEPRERRKER